MKKTIIGVIVAMITITTGCTNGANKAGADNTDKKAYKELTFGMPVEEVKAKGYIEADKPTNKNDAGYDMYPSKIKDMSGVDFESNTLYFCENQLVQVRLIRYSKKKDEALETWETIYNTVKATYGNPKKEEIDSNKAAEWRIGDKRITCRMKKEINLFSDDSYINTVNIIDDKLIESLEKSKLEKFEKTNDI